LRTAVGSKIGGSHHHILLKSNMDPRVPDACRHPDAKLIRALAAKEVGTVFFAVQTVANEKHGDMVHSCRFRSFPRPRRAVIRSRSGFCALPDANSRRPGRSKPK